MNKHKHLFTKIGIGSIFLILAGVVYASTWVGPTGPAPTNNVPAPINVGSMAQTKTGDLSISGDLTVGVTSNPIAAFLIHGKGQSESTQDSDPGHTLVTKDYIDGRLLPPVCSSYTYDAWGACVASVQTRSVTASIPSGCVGGPAPVTSQACVVPTCTYTYSGWSACAASVQTRSVVTALPAGCTGTPVTSQACVMPSFSTPITACAAGTIFNYNFRNAAIAAGWNGVDKVNTTVTINAGCVITSAAAGSPAFTTGTPFPAGSTITIVNNGSIVGKGGDGGTGEYNGAGTNGGNGGPAISLSYPATIQNNGIIGGGGGGGGGGYCGFHCGGGGGGGGAGFGGAGAQSALWWDWGPGGNGVAGSVSAGGAGSGNAFCSVWGGAGGGAGGGGANGNYSASSFCGGGGGGGGLGANGGTTDPAWWSAYGTPGAGGSAGAAILKNGNVLTWSVFGAVYGSVI